MLTTIGLSEALRSQRLTELVGEVWIGRQALLLDGDLVSWSGMTRLEAVGLNHRNHGASVVVTMLVLALSPWQGR